MIFSELRGQARAVEQLRSAWARGRLHHGLLFIGPPGVGKAHCAEALAALLLCHSPTAEQEACTRCPACTRVAKRTHPDLLSLSRELAKSGKRSAELKVTQVRALQQQLAYQAFEGGRRVVLIEEAERLNLAAANALLKTLEEPSPGTYFILLSDAPERLLPTIRSRCQLIRFSPLEAGLLQTLLQEQRTLAEEEAAFVARLSEGSLGRAKALIGSELLGERIELLETLDREDRLRGVEGRLKRAEQLAKRPEEELRLLLHLLRSWFRDVLFCRHGLSREVLVHQDREAQLRARAEVLDEQGLRWRLEALDEAERQLFDRHSDRRLILENLFLYLGGGAALFQRPLKL